MTGKSFCTLPIYQRHHKVLFYRKANIGPNNGIRTEVKKQWSICMNKYQ